MKIIYLLSSNQTPVDHGVLNKVHSQKKSLERLNIEIKVYSFGLYYIDNTNDFSINHIYVSNIKGIKIYQKILFYISLINKIINIVKSEKPDLIYLRDSGFKMNLHKRLSKIAPLFIEIQTNYLNEMKYINKKRYIFERIINRYYLNYSKGLIYITNEIYKIERKYTIKNFIMGNGVDINEVEKLDAVKEDDFINLLFIGSDSLGWHGVDRLINSFIKAPNKSKFKIHIIGVKNTYNIRSDQIRFYGILNDKNKLNEIFSRADIGVGTLALYRKGMNEAAPLKTRHYLAKGLPVIIGYNDVDLSNNLDFILRFPNDESLLDFEMIERFYYKTKKLRKENTIVNYALKNLTWDRKMEELINFLLQR